MNHKRVNQLYRIANLAVRKHKKVKRTMNERVPLQIGHKCESSLEHGLCIRQSEQRPSVKVFDGAKLLQPCVH